MTSYFKKRLEEIRSNPDLISPFSRRGRGGVVPIKAATMRARQPEALGKAGWVYFAVDDERETVKIGFSTNPDSRLSSLQTGNRRKLHLEATIPAFAAVEKEIHNHFARDRIQGEWFRLTDDIEELWDDVWDYQGIRCARLATGDMEPGYFEHLLESVPLDLIDISAILSTINQVWDDEFRARIRTPTHIPPSPHYKETRE